VELHRPTATLASLSRVPGKPAEEITSYRLISLLPILSKLFEKLFLTRIKPIIQEKRIIPDHQFSFRQKHATIEHVHHITTIINKVLESNKYCKAAFPDITQVFDIKCSMKDYYTK
jgi:hypothetical protein